MLRRPEELKATMLFEIVSEEVQTIPPPVAALFATTVLLVIVENEVGKHMIPPPALRTALFPAITLLKIGGEEEESQ